jgi:hypothetical protein
MKTPRSSVCFGRAVIPLALARLCAPRSPAHIDVCRAAEGGESSCRIAGAGTEAFAFYGLANFNVLASFVLDWGAKAAFDEASENAAA